MFDAVDIRILRSKLLKYHKVLPNGCWRWTRCVNSCGYGCVYSGGIPISTHRASMMVFKPDEYKDFLMVLHKCNYRRCINPDHLYCGTGSDNTNDSVRAGTHPASSKQFCIRGHEFTEENTYIGPTDGYRRCKKCIWLTTNLYEAVRSRKS